MRDALAVALEHDLTPVAAELYQRLSLVLYDAADYRRAQETLETALALCRTSGEPGTEVACVTCMVYVLRECGEWPEALKLGRELISTGTAVWVAEGLIGVIHMHQGKLSSARRLMSSSLAAATRLDHFNMFVDTTGGLARLAAAEGAGDEAAERCQALLARWEHSEDHHYAVKGLRWARPSSPGGRPCGRARVHRRSDPHLVRDRPCRRARRAVARDRRDGARDGDAETAAEQIGHAVELHRGLDLPFERAEIELRAGVALAAAGEREPALDRLRDAYRTARKLGARPLAAEAAGEVAALGESVVRAWAVERQADADGAGLSAPRARGRAAGGGGPHEPRDR